MKISYAYLTRQFDTPLPSPEAVADLFTFRVFEMEGIEKVGDDTIFDLKVLPDRAHYALSWEGITYELAAALGVSPKKSVVEEVKVSGPALDLRVEDSKLCRRYIGRRVESVTVGVSPQWLIDALAKVGQRSINSIVDLTNYVMLYTGQPLHAFDADKVEGALVVRCATEGEMITTLDGKEVKLDSTMLVVADDKGPLAIAGVKGGKRAEVTQTTTRLILESANFEPVSVRRTSGKVGIKNDSSKRFENDMTPDLAVKGMLYISGLIAEVCPAASFGTVVDVYPVKAQSWNVSFSPEVARQALGHDIADSEMEKILTSLQLLISKKDGAVWTLEIPTFRLDLIIPEDITEEIGRLVGYDKITPVLPPAVAKAPAVNSQFYIIEQIKNILIAEGYCETILYTLGKKGHYETAYPVASDKAFLRTSLSPNLEASIVMNTRNADLLGADIVKQFEIGKVFDASGEHTHLGLAVGFAKKRKGTIPADILMQTMEKIGEGLSIKSESRDLCAWGEVSLDEYIQSAKNIPVDYTSLLFAKASSAKYVPISAYPFAVRDVAVFVPTDVSENAAREVIEPLKGSYCVRLAMFDVFTKDAKTSYAFRLVFQAQDKTLTEEEINTPMNAIYAALKAKGWEIR